MARLFSRFEVVANEIASALVQFVPLDAPVKISRLRLHNGSNRARRISVTGYVEWVLAASQSAGAPFTTTEIDATTGAMFARNRWNGAFGSHVAFVDWLGRQQDWTGDRTEFIGRDGAIGAPAAVIAGEPMSNVVGARLDPCGALPQARRNPGRRIITAERGFPARRGVDRRTRTPDSSGSYRETDSRRACRTRGMPIIGRKY